MTVSLKHQFVSNVADSPDATLVQPSNWNAEHLLTANSDSLLGAVTTGNVVEITCTSAGRDLLDDANASAQRDTLGLGSIATQNANNVSITGGSVSGITDLAIADGGTGSSTAAGAATNLGLGTGDSPQFAAVNIGNATDTTITRVSAGLIAVEGKTVVTENGAQTVEFAAGSNTAPSITTTGDTNTGIFFPAADTIAFTEGGVEAMRVDSSGNVGIGKTASASFKLDVNGAISDSKGDVRVIVVNSQTTGYTLVAGDSGKLISITTGGVTVPSSLFGAGDAISIYNNSANNQTITQGSNVTMYFSGSATTGNRTLAQRGLCTVLCVSSNTFVISGAGLS